MSAIENDDLENALTYSIACSEAAVSLLLKNDVNISEETKQLLEVFLKNERVYVKMICMQKEIENNLQAAYDKKKYQYDYEILNKQGGFKLN